MRHTIAGNAVLPKIPTAPTGFTAVLLGSNQASLAWTNPPSTIYDGIQIERNLNGAGYAVLATPSKGTNTYTDTQGYSSDTLYRLVAYKSAWSNAAAVVSANVRSLPQVPSLIDFSRATAFTPHDLSWINPGHPNIAGFDVAISKDGTWNATVVLGVVTTYRFANPPSNVVTDNGVQVYRGRCRTRDSFGAVSAWNTWSVDVT